MFIPTLACMKLDGWNTRVLTEKDAADYCRRNKIYVIDAPQESYGRIVFYRDRVFILINPRLSAAMRTWVLFHEIGHFLLHAPNASKFSPLVKRKNDREANYIAAVAMMPRSRIVGKTFPEIANELDCPLALVEIRSRILAYEGI